MRPDAFAGLLEDFNQPETLAIAAQPALVEPTFIAAELEAVRQEAWNDGYMTGSAANNHEVGRDIQRTFTELLARSDDLDKRLAARAEQSATSIARWLVSTFIAAFPALSNGPLAGRGGLVADLLHATLTSQSTIEVRSDKGQPVSFHTMFEVCREIEARQLEDPSGSNIVIAWQQGSAQLDPSRTWEEIRSAIMPLAAGETADNTFHLAITPGEPSRHG